MRFERPRRNSSTSERKSQHAARPLVAAALLSLTAVAALSQELDPHNDRVFTLQRRRESVQAEAANVKAQGMLEAICETAAASVSDPVPTATTDPALTRAQVTAELRHWRAAHKTAVGEPG